MIYKYSFVSLKRSKTLFCLLAVFFVNTGILNAQTFAGFKTGLNISNVKYADSRKNDLVSPYKKTRKVPIVGVVLNYSMNKIISVQPEIIFSPKGFKFKQPLYSEGKSVMDYLEIPVIAKYNIIAKRDKALSPFIGGYAGFWLYGKYVSTNYYTGNKTTVKVNFKNQTIKYNRVDAGLVLGISYDFKQKKRISNIELRYSHSMLGSSKETADALLLRTLTLSYSYLFRIKK